MEKIEEVLEQICILQIHIVHGKKRLMKIQMNLSKTTEKEVQENVKLLNNRPRKCINYKTHNEYFKECLLECCT